jgi:hypothetical protein
MHSVQGLHRRIPAGPSDTGTTLVSRRFQPRNTGSDVTYATIIGPDLTFPLGEA